MRRIPIVVAVTLLAVALAGPAAAAGKPSQTCGNAASGYFVVNVDEWWDITVDGFEAAGITVYEDDGTFTQEFEEFAAAAGFGDGAGLEHFVRVDQWAGIDHNGNGLVCMKTRPITPGNPAYFFNGVDDEASSPGGDTR